MVFGEETTDMEIKVQDEVIEDVKEFVYLGSLLTWKNVHELNIAAQRAGLKINVDKTKAMVFGEETTDMEIKVQDEVIAQRK